MVTFYIKSLDSNAVPNLRPFAVPSTCPNLSLGKLLSLTALSSSIFSGNCPKMGRRFHLVSLFGLLWVLFGTQVSASVISGDSPTSHWMGLMADVLGPMNIPDMVLPGTHDSGTYNLTDSIERDPDDLPELVVELIKILQDDFGILEPYDIIKTWAKTQQYDVYGQLVRGNRFVDIRVCWDGQTCAETLDLAFAPQTHFSSHLQVSN